MTAKIISVCNQKGGSGKTTITMALAAAFADRGSRVLVVDGDPQGSASTWSANAPDEAPFPAAVANLSRAGRSLPNEVRKMVGDYDLVLIDCPPAVDSPVPQAALLISDLALVPLIPSPLDVAAAVPFIRLIQDACVLNEELKGLVVANMVQKNTKVATGYLEHFSALSVPTANTYLALRTSHRQAVALGTSVDRLGDREAAAEVKGLMKEVQHVLRNPGEARPEAVAP